MCDGAAFTDVRLTGQKVGLLDKCRIRRAPFHSEITRFHKRDKQARTRLVKYFATTYS
jgi:hypothetical protein